MKLFDSSRSPWDQLALPQHDTLDWDQLFLRPVAISEHEKLCDRIIFYSNIINKKVSLFIFSIVTTVLIGPFSPLIPMKVYQQIILTPFLRMTS